MFEGLHDLAVGSPVVGAASTSALDEVEAGLIVVGQDFEVEFIIRAFYHCHRCPMGTATFLPTLSNMDGEPVCTLRTRPRLKITSDSAKANCDSPTAVF